MVMNFIEKLKAGTVAVSSIDDYINEWHDGDSILELHEYLGMAFDEYGEWVMRGNRYLMEHFVLGVVTVWTDKETHRTSVAQRLKKARERKGLTQHQVQHETNIPSATISGYENEVAQPNLYKLSLLAKLYEVSTDWIINGDGRNAE